MTRPSPLSRWGRDFALAARLLTRLPLGRGGVAEPGELARATRAMPLVGLVIALSGGLAYAIGQGLDLPSFLSALVALAATLLMTGALHEDGLADTADGFGGGLERLHKLEIMRLSNIGTYGVLAVVISLGLRAGALSALFEPGAVTLALIAAHALARAALPPIMAVLPLAREDGLAAGVGYVPASHAWTATLLGALIALLALGFWTALIGALAAVGAAALVARIAQGQIGGYTGDVLGAAEQAVECAVLLAVVAYL